MNNTTLSGEQFVASPAVLSLLGQQMEVMVSSINTLWAFFCALLVFFMQAGFGMFEAGSVQEKNHRSILFKNLMSLGVGGFTFLFFGYHLAFGASSSAAAQWIGFDTPFSMAWREPMRGYGHVLYMFGFSMASSAIVSGAMNERTKLAAFIWMTFVLTVFVQPTVMHWAWAQLGWMSPYNMNSVMGVFFIDFAGSGVVHTVGAVAALQAARCVGPRLRPARFNKEGRVRQISGNNASISSLGVLILWFCWFGFNSGGVLMIETTYGNSTMGCPPSGDPSECGTLGLRITETSSIAGRAVFNTIISPIIACLTALLAGRLWSGILQWLLFVKKEQRRLTTIKQIITKSHFDLNNILHGILVGLVAIDGPCATVSPATAAVIGFVAAIAYLIIDTVLIKLQIDDPINSFAIHGSGGLVGVLGAAFSSPEYVAQVYHRNLPGVGLQMGVQLMGFVVIVAWSAFWSYAVFGVMQYIPTNRDEQPNILRIPLELEESGADLELNWGIGRRKQKRSLAEYLSRVQNELPASDPLDEMNNEAYLNLPTSRAVLRYVIDHYKPYFIVNQQYSDEEEEGDEPAQRRPTAPGDPWASDDDAVVSYSLSEKSD